MPGPTKPTDAELIPWAQHATTGDNPLDARWYIPFVRAINERLRAINALPIAEDLLHYWFPPPPPSPFNPIISPGDAPYETAWGQEAINTHGGINPGPGYGVAFGTETVPEAQIGLNPFETNTQGQYTVGGGGVGGLLTSIATVVTASATSVVVNYESASGDASDPDQRPQLNISINTPPEMIATGWIPNAGDKVVVFVVDLTPGSFPTFFRRVYPTDYYQHNFGYPLIYFYVMQLTFYFVDPNVSFDGKTKPQMQTLCAAHQEWWDHFQGSIFGPGGILAASQEATGTRLGIPPGSSYTNNGEYFFDLSLRSIFQTAGPYWPLQSDIAPDAVKPDDWPASVPFFGFTRKREREITTLLDSGADGQVARFICSNFSQWDDGTDGPNFEDPRFFGPPSWSPPAASHPATPTDERKYARQVMLRQGGQWIVHPDPAVQPDIVAFYGMPQPGDIFGPWCVNELKKAINLLTTSLTFETIWSGASFDVHGTETGSNNQAQGSDGSSYGHTASTAGAEADYMAHQSLGSIGNDGIIYAYTAAGNDISGPSYWCGSSCAKLYLYSPAHTKNRDVSFYLASSLPLNGADFPGTGGSIMVFDSAGLAASGPTYATPDGATTTIGAIWKVGTVAGTSADHVDWTGGYVGSVPKWLPTWPGVPAIGDPNNSRGILLFPIGCTCNWKVDGGFAYV